jgi:hypothetical protein
MKPEVLDALLTARALFDTARRQCVVRDRHTASAGLIVLQDAVELVLYSCLIEKGVDEGKAVESFSFDQLIGELKSAGLPVIKSGTLKAMNKQRVLIKHYAQLAEPAAVRQYYEASLLASDALLVAVIGKPLQHIVVADAISPPPLKAHIEEATRCIEDRRYLEAMIATRKALFLAVEADYDIGEWSEYDPTHLLPRPVFGKQKAPLYTRNKSWIQSNVTDPIDYVQLDHERVSVEMMELGIDPAEFFNVWRLTPDVYRVSDDVWAVKTEAKDETAATEDNARYCLDVVVSVVLSQQLRKDITRVPLHRGWRARLLRAQAVLKRASLDSEPQGVILAVGDFCEARYRVSGLDGQSEFVRVHPVQWKAPPEFFSGYIPLDSCELELRQFDEPLTKAETEFGRQQERAAIAEADTLALRMDLMRMGARENLLVGSARSRLITSLKPFAGQGAEVRFGLSIYGTVQGVVEPAGPDVLGLAGSLIKVLQEAQWGLPIAPTISSLQFPPGMTVQISPTASLSTVKAADALVKSLQNVPFEVQGPFPTELSANPRIRTTRLFTPDVPGGPATEKPLPPQTDETIVLVVLAHPK